MAIQQTGEAISQYMICIETNTDIYGDHHIIAYWLVNSNGRPIAKLLTLEDARIAARRLASVGTCSNTQALASHYRII